MPVTQQQCQTTEGKTAMTPTSGLDLSFLYPSPNTKWQRHYTSLCWVSNDSSNKRKNHKMYIQK